MFDIIKQQVSLLAELEKDLNVTFKQSGERNWVIDGDKDIESCPFCGHHDCFKLSHTEGDNSSSFYKCFSCGETGDVITWKAKRDKVDMGEAARTLAKEHNIELPRGYSPIQNVFNLAAAYYHNCLIDVSNKPLSLLNNLTPLAYQLEERKHKRETIDKYKIGYSDGNLIDYLTSLGIDEEVLEESGLMNKNGKDFLPRNCFIYPHYVKGGKVSHFTFKDPLKKLAYQIPKKNSLNGYAFYGQETFDSASMVVLVEGENDRLSVLETGLAPAVLATIGTLSNEQLMWLKDHGKEKFFVTVFDPDAAGDKYREKIEQLRRFFKGLIHVKPPEDKDIDDHITSGANFAELLKNNQVKVVPNSNDKPQSESPILGDLFGEQAAKKAARPPETKKIQVGDISVPTEDLNRPKADSELSVNPFEEEKSSVRYTPPAELSNPASVQYTPPSSVTQVSYEGDLEGGNEEEAVVIEDCPVYQNKGAYWKIRFKDGETQEIRISNFYIELKNVYAAEEGGLTREVVIRRMDGFKSEPFLVDSETKVGNKPFRVIAANMADCEWLGTETDLASIWRLVYSKFSNSIIKIPKQTGRHPNLNAWIFKNVLVTGSGVPITSDENGVFWVTGRSLGVKPQGISQQTHSQDADGIPYIETSMTRQEADDLLKEATHQLAKNLGSPGLALLALGWIQSNAYSDLLFKVNNGMSIFMLWGSHGEGKSTVGKWLLNFYSMASHGAITVNLLGTGVGFLRKSGYYGSLPMMIDEMRNDEESNRFMGMIRAWYDREGRSLADKTTGGVINQKIRSNLILVGEDLPTDPATKERCVSIRVPKNGRETKVSYEWFQANSHLLSNIGYYWILDSCSVDSSSLISEMKVVDEKLKASGCSSRISKNWSAAGYFGQKLAEKYFPEFDFLTYLGEEGIKEQASQKAETTLMKFFEAIEVAMAASHTEIDSRNILVEPSEDVIHIWFASVFRYVMRDDRNKTNWSKLAILRALKEEPYFISDNKKIAFGMEESRHQAITLRLSNAPEVIRNIAKIKE